MAAAGFALFAVPAVGGSYWTTFFPAMVVLGLGMSITVAPLTTAVMNAVDAGFEGAASGINNAASRVAALLAIALFGIVMTTVFNRELHRHLAAADLAPAVIEAVEQQRGKLAAIAIPGGMNPRDNLAAHNAIALAFVSGFRWIMLASAALALASAACAWFLIGSASRRPDAPGPAQN